MSAHCLECGYCPNPDPGDDEGSTHWALGAFGGENPICPACGHDNSTSECDTKE